MARPKKNGTYLNVCIETPIYERLENFCKDAGHTKTVAVERALISYFDEYEEMKKKLKELESKGFVTFTVMGNTNSVVWRLYFYLHGGKYRCTGRDFFNWLPAIP